MSAGKGSFLRRAYEKFFLNTVAWIVRKDPRDSYYLFSFALKKEAAGFYTEHYIRQYRHIEAAIDLAKKINRTPNEKKLILDIGGGNGDTAAMFAAAFPGTQIMIFEPVLKNREHMQPLLASNKDLLLIPKA